MNISKVRLSSSLRMVKSYKKGLRSASYIGRYGVQTKRPHPLKMALSINGSSTGSIEYASAFALQLDLLTGQYIDPKDLKIKRRFVGKKQKSHKSEKKQLQYKIPFWKGVKGERKRTLKARCHEDEGNDLVVFEMTDDGYAQFLIRVLEYLPREIAALGSRDSSRIAEIVAWANRRFTEDPFSFEDACRAAGVHPDIQRDNLIETLKELYGETFDHYRILRNNVIDAEAGNPQAVDWVLSDSDVAKSFNDCCRALGFNPRKARPQVMIPAHMVPEPIDQDSTSIETLPTPPVIDENQALFDFG